MMIRAVAAIVIVQLACGIISAFLAHRKRWNTKRWFLKGALQPLVGIVHIIFSDAGSRAGKNGVGGQKTHSRKKRRPKRCCGRYIPDCEGCPFFKKLLFEEHKIDGMKGRCLFYKRDLMADPRRRGGRVVLEDEENGEEEEA